MTRTRGVNAAAFIELCKRLLAGTDKPIHLVVDRHPAHHAKITTRYVETHQ